MNAFSEDDAAFTKKLFHSERCTRLGEKSEICSRHGEYLSVGTNYLGLKDVWTKCALCKREQEQLEADKRLKDKIAEHTAQMERYLQQAGIPDRFKNAEFDNYKCELDAQKKALGVCRDYANRFDQFLAAGRGLLMLGNLGTGKTHLAVAIVRKVLQRHTSIFTTASGLLKSITDTYSSNDQGRRDQVQRAYQQAHLLVIDEIGVQKGSEHEQLLISEILLDRYANNLSTIIISNAPEIGYTEDGVFYNGVLEYVGPRSFDRFNDTMTRVRFDWAGYRKDIRKTWADG